MYVVFLNHYIVVKLFDHFSILNYLDWKVASFIYILVVSFIAYLMYIVRKKIEKEVVS